MRYFALSLGVAACFALSIPSANAEGTYIGRFACGRAGVSYEPRPTGQDGFGPTNLFVLATLSGSQDNSNSGYVCEVLGTKPPTAQTGFRTFRLAYQLSPKSPNAFEISSVQFHFKRANGSEAVFTKLFSQMTKSTEGVNTYVSVTADDFADGTVKESNLIKFIPYIDSNKVEEIFVGDFKVTTGKGTLPPPVLQFQRERCPVIDD